MRQNLRASSFTGHLAGLGVLFLNLTPWSRLLNGYCYGVVSYKAPHLLRPFSDLLWVPI
jgi:hypothetical protein